MNPSYDINPDNVPKFPAEKKQPPDIKKTPSQQSEKHSEVANIAIGATQEKDKPSASPLSGSTTQTATPSQQKIQVIAAKYGLTPAGMEAMVSETGVVFSDFATNEKLLATYDATLTKVLTGFKFQNDALFFKEDKSGKPLAISKQTVMKVVLASLTTHLHLSEQGGAEIEVGNERFYSKKVQDSHHLTRIDNAVLIGQGAYSTASSVMSVSTGQFDVLKTLRSDVLQSPNLAKAKGEIDNEFNKLREIHQAGRVRGIKDTPHTIINLLGKTGPVYGILDTKYIGSVEFFLDEALPTMADETVMIDGCLQLLEGLDHLDKLDLRHGDIKPQNVLGRFNSAGGWDLQLGDLGGAKYFNELNFVTNPEIVDTAVGTTTKFFVSSEDSIKLSEALGRASLDEFKAIEKKRDVFGMGMTLFYIVAGDYPYQPYPEGHDLAGHPDVSPGFPQEALSSVFAGDLGIALGGILKAMLEPDYEKRISADVALKQFQGFIKQFYTPVTQKTVFDGS